MDKTPTPTRETNDTTQPFTFTLALMRRTRKERSSSTRTRTQIPPRVRRSRTRPARPQGPPNPSGISILAQEAGFPHASRPAGEVEVTGGRWCIQCGVSGDRVKRWVRTPDGQAYFCRSCYQKRWKNNLHLTMVPRMEERSWTDERFLMGQPREPEGRRESRERVCVECASTSSSSWIRTADHEGHRCYRCYYREKKRREAEEMALRLQQGDYITLGDASPSSSSLKGGERGARGGGSRLFFPMDTEVVSSDEEG